MVTPLTIALDVMGGDHGPDVAIPGANLSLIRHPDLKFLLFGDQLAIEKRLEKFPKLAASSEIVHTDIHISMEEKPSQALRKGRWKSGMWLAIQAVRDGKADAVVSAGNTGALMAMSKFCLKTMPEIERPAIAAIWPTVDSECIVLDVGANVGADAAQLEDFAMMGAALARALFSLDKPSVGLLNIGVEEVKGLEQVREAAAALRRTETTFTYHGFVEGADIGHGVVDVVVTEGFSGNIALKTAEGTAKQIGSYLKAAMNRSLLARLGAFLAQGAFVALREKMDPRRSNGGLFLGLNGIVIKSHGGTDSTGYACAIDLGYDMVRSGLIERLSVDIKKFHAELEQDVAGAEEEQGAIHEQER